MAGRVHIFALGMGKFRTASLLVLLFSTGLAAQADRVAPDIAPATAARSSQIPPECLRRIPEDFVPMTRTERASHYLHSLLGMNTVLSAVVRSGFNQALDRPDEWGQGGRGFGYRVASSYSQAAVATTFKEGIALGLDEDNRYFSSGETGLRNRLRYALESAFLARHDDGSRSLSFSEIGGPMAGAFISRLWQPDSAHSVSSAFSSFGISIGIHVGLDAAREFAPGFVRRLLP
jgi:hypothetical protein